MSSVTINNATKHYGRIAALDRVSIDFSEGEFFGLLGPSGSGKTTLLRAIAGFVELDKGEISIGGSRVEAMPAHRREIGMVFQNYALFPHLTVAENIGFGLSVRGISRKEIGSRVTRMLDLVRLPGIEGRFPRELSGGQQQRVALARAIVTRPKVLLLDEPLGALDRRLRQEMQIELRQIQQEIGVTTIFVTHDQEEALSLSDRIGIIHQGKLVQIGAPLEVYEHPSSLFSASFLGDANVLEGVSDGKKVRLSDGVLIKATTACPVGKTILMVRPEKLHLFRENEPIPEALSNRLFGAILQAIYTGNAMTYRVQAEGVGKEPILVFSQNLEMPPFAPKTRVGLAWSPQHTIRVES